MDKKFYQDLLDQMSDGVYFVNLDRRITYWNGGAERITGYGAHEVLGHSCAEGLLRHIRDSGQQLCLHRCPLLAVMKDGNAREAHVFLHHKDGQRVPVTVWGQAIRSPGGEIVGSVEVFHARGANPYSGQRQDRKDDSVDTVTGLARRGFGELHLNTLIRAQALMLAGFTPPRAPMGAGKEAPPRLVEVTQRLLLNGLRPAGKPRRRPPGGRQLCGLGAQARRGPFPGPPHQGLLKAEVPHVSGVAALLQQKHFLCGGRVQRRQGRTGRCRRPGQRRLPALLLLDQDRPARPGPRQVLTRRPCPGPVLGRPATQTQTPTDRGDLAA